MDRNIVQELCEALEPFARFAEHQDAFRREDAQSFCATIINGGTGETSKLTCGDLRKARAVLAKAKAGFNEGGAR